MNDPAKKAPRGPVPQHTNHRCDVGPECALLDPSAEELRLKLHDDVKAGPERSQKAQRFHMHLPGKHPVDEIEGQIRELVQGRLERYRDEVDRVMLQALANGKHGIAVVEHLGLAPRGWTAEIHEDVRVPYGTIVYVKDLDHLEHADLPEAPRETLVAALAHLASLELARR